MAEGTAQLWIPEAQMIIPAFLPRTYIRYNVSGEQIWMAVMTGLKGAFRHFVWCGIQDACQLLHRQSAVCFPHVQARVILESIQGQGLTCVALSRRLQLGGQYQQQMFNQTNVLISHVKDQDICLAPHLLLVLSTMLQLFNATVQWDATQLASLPDRDPRHFKSHNRSQEIMCSHKMSNNRSWYLLLQ